MKYINNMPKKPKDEKIICIPMSYTMIDGRQYRMISQDYREKFMRDLLSDSDMTIIDYLADYVVKYKKLYENRQILAGNIVSFTTLEIAYIFCGYKPSDIKKLKSDREVPSFLVYERLYERMCSRLQSMGINFLSPVIQF